MKKILVIAAMFALALTLVGCGSPASLGVDSTDGTTIKVKAEGKITAEDVTNITIPEGGGVSAVSELEEGSIDVEYLNAQGEAVFTDNFQGEGTSNGSMDAGEYSVKIKATGATGTLTITALDAEGLLAAHKAIDPNFEENTAVAGAADQGVQIAWNSVADAAAAAKGAGFDRFEVPASFTFGQLDFANPMFSYADGVARASYETAASGVYICKADGSHTAPLSERSVSDFAATWTTEVNGFPVTCYGAQEGAATMIEWSEGSQDYCVTYQGLGGEEMAMSADEVASIVPTVM